MTEATLHSPAGLVADPALRFPPVRPTREEIDDAVSAAAAGLAQLLNASFRRLGRFFSGGAQTHHAGGSGAFAHLRDHVSALHSAARGGIKDALRAEGPAYRDLLMNRSALSALPATALHGNPRRAANGFAAPVLPAASNPYGSLGVMARLEAIKAFAETHLAEEEVRDGFQRLVAAERRIASEIRRREHGDDAAAPAARRVDVGPAAARLRQAAAGTALGAMMSLRLTADTMVNRRKRLKRFFDKSAKTLHAGVTQTLETAQANLYGLLSSPYGRLGAMAAAVGGIAAVGLGAEYLSNLDLGTAAQGVGALADAGLAPPIAGDVFTHETVRVGADTLTVASHVAPSASGAGTAATNFAVDAAQKLAASDAGAAIVRAGHASAEPVSSAFATSAPGAAADLAAALPKPPSAATVQQMAEQAGQAVHQKVLEGKQLASALKSKPVHLIQEAAQTVKANSPEFKQTVQAALAHKPAIDHKTVLSAADVLNSMQIKLTVLPVSETASPSAEFLHKVRYTMGFDNPFLAEDMVRSLGEQANTCTQITGNGGVCSFKMVGPNGASVVVDPGQGAYTLFDSTGATLAQQHGGEVRFRMGETGIQPYAFPGMKG